MKGVLATLLVWCSTLAAIAAPAPMPNYVGYVTNAAVKSGNASDVSVWSHPPVDGDWLGVPSGINITWDLQGCPRLGGLYIEGTIDAGTAPGNLVLNVGTVFVSMGGAFRAGDCMHDAPLAADTLTVTFLDVPLDPVKDPAQFSGGFLAMGGTLDMCGSANKDGWLTTSGCRKGDTTITLSAVPNDWNPGDRLLIPGCFLAPAQDEVIAIQSVTGVVVTLAAPLQYDHVTVPQPQGQPNTLPIGNLTRRITFKSENPSGVRGHCMFMKDGASGMPSMVTVCHIAVRDCGRTLATQPVTDPQVDTSGALVPGTADNVRARYAWHSHRQGQGANALQTWDAIVVERAKKWCFDNHDSWVNATNLVGFDCQGSIFATERGSEIGTYTHCLGVRTSGVAGQAGFNFENARGANQDYGWQGDGIWAQGPGVTLVDNVLVGHPDAGVHVFTMGPRAFATGPAQQPIDGTGILASTFNRSFLPGTFKPLNPNSDPLIVQVPLFGVSGNASVGCAVGHIVDWNQTDTVVAFSTPVNSVVDSPSSWNCPTGLLAIHNSNLQIDSPVFSGPSCAVGSIGINISAYSHDYAISNLAVGGFETGLNTPAQGLAVAGNCYFSNVWDVVDTTPNDHQAVNDFRGCALSFVAPPASLLAGRTQQNFLLAPLVRYFFDLVDNKNPNDWFYPITWRLPNDLQLFKVEQAGSFIPNDPIFGGLTNAQLRARYGVSVGDFIPGAPVASSYASNGIIAAAQPSRPCFMFGADGSTSYWQSSITTYQLRIHDYKNALTFTAPPTVLQPGWNALTEAIGGQTYTFWVQCAGAPPPPSSATTIRVQAVELRSLQCSAQVTSNGLAVNEGTVTFTCGSVSVQAPVTNGLATGVLVGVSPGGDSVQASYSGGADFQASSGNVTLTVN